MVSVKRNIFSLKSWLFTPATKANRFNRAAEVGAGVLIIDLEDSVSQSAKCEARHAAIQFLSSSPASETAHAIRINAPKTKDGFEDLGAILGSAANPDFIFIPKCDSWGVVGLVDALLKESGKSTEVIALIESTTGVAALDRIPNSQPKPAALAFGAADMAADLGTQPDWSPLLFIRSRIVLAATLAGIAVLDAPYFNLSDVPALWKETKAAAELGFHGKCAIHPAQIQMINEVFSPTAEEVNDAQRVLALSQQGVSSLDGRMVDEAIARKARLILARAGMEGKKRDE